MGTATPLFTTLVPVYKTDFIEDILQCLQAQTSQNFKVIFSDDSPTQDLADIIDEWQAHEAPSFAITVIQGPRIGPVSNCHHLLHAWGNDTPYMHFLFDDDLIFPDFYAAHELAYAQTQADACLSARIIVSEAKAPLFSPALPDFITGNPQRVTLLNRQACVDTILPFCNNWLGELSFATFTSQAITNANKGRLQQIPYYGLNDLGLFMELLATHSVSYINSNLGAFRKNRTQTSQDAHSKVFQSTIISWASIIFDAHSKGWLSTEQTVQGLKKTREMIQSMAKGNAVFAPILSSLADLEDIETAKNAFHQNWRLLLASNPDALNA